MNITNLKLVSKVPSWCEQVAAIRLFVRVKFNMMGRCCDQNR